MTSTSMPLALSATRSTSIFNQVLLVLGASLLLTLSAKIQVPFWPVPMTMQSYMVLVLGMALGPRLGPAAVAVYLAQGAIGLPVFAGTPEKGIGLAYMAGPTGGYLLGFFVAAVITGQCKLAAGASHRQRGHGCDLCVRIDLAEHINRRRQSHPVRRRTFRARSSVEDPAGDAHPATGLEISRSRWPWG